MPIKAVIDTNIWISALVSAGNPRAIADAIDANRLVLICSDELIAELIRVLQRSKFADTIPDERVQRIVSLIREKAVFVQLQHIPAVSRDPKDDMFLACAAASEADFLVTGDDDLLNLQKYGTTRIVTPREFLDILASGA